MARQRRGGFRPPELRGTLGTLLRTTLAQAGGLRDALERGAREGRARLDDALASRRRTDVLAELGEIVLDLIRRGEIDLDQIPEARATVEQLDQFDDGEDPADDRDIAPAPRARFDDRAAKDDGTVSSTRWKAPAKKPAARVWRPAVEPPPEAELPPPVLPPAARLKKGGISFGNDDADDADLAEYMHPDDVPPKPR
ncbi:MAG: hypothetical protein ABI678_30145 [Kofleriaceae bacterium]